MTEPSNDPVESDVDEELEDKELDISIEALDSVDLSLPEDYLDEVFAMELLTVITRYHTCVAERRAFRHQGKGSEAEKMSTQAAIYRAQAALIQHEHPNTRELYKELADARAVATRKDRKPKSKSKSKE